MQEDLNVVSKVLVYDADTSVLEVLKHFCATNNLIGLRAQQSSVLDALSSSNIELGAILLSDVVDESGKSGIDLAVELHRVRSELPIFLRRTEGASLDDLPESVQQIFAGVYHIDDIGKLKTLIDTYLFGQHFPNELVRGICEMTTEMLEGVFVDVDISTEPPYVVKDKFIYGELLSLMLVESQWCRGYMMLQTEEMPLMELIRARKTTLIKSDFDFRSVNTILSEISNLTWGGFKSRFVGTGQIDETQHRIQVPIIVHHGQRYITFGSDDPQLCFRYVLQDTERKLSPVKLLQKFVFSLSWTPEKFHETQQNLDDLINGGELELF